MGIYKQPNRWQCGPFALKHALLVHGILVPESEISRVAGTNQYGTDEVKLAKAARRYGCDLSTLRRLRPERARRLLVDYLRRDIPCLLCIDEWDHWVTVVKEEKGQFILLDSRDPAVLVIATWPQLKGRWVFHEPDEFDDETIHTVYDLHPLVPRGRVRTREFAQLWDEYVDDLLAICRPRTALSKDVISLGEFLRRHESMILDQLEYWHGDIKVSAARRVLEHMHMVADTYGLVIRRDDEKRAIAAICIILGLWSAAEHGVLPVYRPQPRTKRRSR
jgi:hypothetical protein